MKRKILFLGETYRADAITWIKGLQEFGDFEVITWELQSPSTSLRNRLLRIFEYLFCIYKIKKIVKLQKPDIVIAERATSYGFLAALCGIKIKIVAQQGISDLWPHGSILYPVKKVIQNYAFKKATLVHAWGEAMLPAMINAKVPLSKIMVLPKGIDLKIFESKNTHNSEKLTAVVTRSLFPEYGHETILKAFADIKNQGIQFDLTIVGDGNTRNYLEKIARELKIENSVHFLGKITNRKLPKILQNHQFYVSMPTTEGVSASLFEAMACKCYPIVSDIAGNQAFIIHRKNGQLIPINSASELAKALILAHQNKIDTDIAVQHNLEFIQKNANYHTNMSIIATKYHELINQNSQ